MLCHIGHFSLDDKHHVVQPMDHLFQYAWNQLPCAVHKSETKNRSISGSGTLYHGKLGICLLHHQASGGNTMNEELKLKNRLKEARMEKNMSQNQLAELVGVSRNTISSIETGQFNPTAKLALILCIALDKKFEELFYF